MKIIKTAGFLDRFPSEIDTAKAQIRQLLQSGHAYSRPEIHSIIKAPKQRITQIALSHMVADGEIDQSMQGMGYKYSLKGTQPWNQGKLAAAPKPPQTAPPPSENPILQQIRLRIDQQAYRGWLEDMGNEDDDGELEYYLEQEHQTRLRPDGIIEFWELTPEVSQIIGDLPVLVYHHTSSRLIPKIKKEGLRTGAKMSNPHMNSQAGIYVTTETSGPAVGGYLDNAVGAHRGNGVTLGIRTTQHQLTPDPDDADISSGARQFILPYVAPQDIVEWGS